MKAGSLDRKVSILRAGPAIDDGFTDTPGTVGVYATRKASWKAANGRETFENLGREAKAGGTFWLRSDTKTRHIAETDQIAFEGRLWDVLGVSEVGGRREGIEVTVAAADGQSSVDLSGLSPLPAGIEESGWSNYADTAGAQLLAANTRTLLTIDAGIKDETQKPSDVVTFWTDNRIQGRDGDDRAIRLKFDATPLDGAASFVLVEFDIGSGSRVVIDSRKFPLTDGLGMAHQFSLSVEMFNRATFGANGCAIYVTSDGPVSLTSKAILIKRGHRA